MHQNVKFCILIIKKYIIHLHEIKFDVLDFPIDAPHMQIYENNNIVHNLKKNLSHV